MILLYWKNLPAPPKKGLQLLLCCQGLPGTQWQYYYLPRYYCKAPGIRQPCSSYCCCYINFENRLLNSASVYWIKGLQIESQHLKRPRYSGKEQLPRLLYWNFRRYLQKVIAHHWIHY